MNKVSGSANLIIHENYNDGNLFNDIALIRTSAIPINGSKRFILRLNDCYIYKIFYLDYIGTVALPSYSDRSVSLDNNKAIVSGFGRNSDLPSMIPNLLYVEAPILPNNIVSFSAVQSNERVQVKNLLLVRSNLCTKPCEINECLLEYKWRVTFKILFRTTNENSLFLQAWKLSR